MSANEIFQEMKTETRNGNVWAKIMLESAKKYLPTLMDRPKAIREWEKNRWNSLVKANVMDSRFRERWLLH